MYYSTENVRKCISEKFEKIKPYVLEELYISQKARVFFKKGKDNYPSGTYVYSDESGYHIEYVGDRGGIVDKYDSDSIFEICFKVCSELISSIALRIYIDNRKPGKDGRRVMFNEELKLLSMIGDEYYIKGKEEIDNILIEHPYDDNLLG